MGMKEYNEFFVPRVGGSVENSVAVNAHLYPDLVVFYAPSLPQDMAISRADAERLLRCLQSELAVAGPPVRR